jgi:multidrug efflux pump subunit AcrA (membrane-fusion protein)
MTNALLLLIGLAATASAQQPAAPQPTAQPSAVTHTAYSARTELFAEWRPFVVGQSTRLTAHLTHTVERFRAFEQGKVTVTLTVGDVEVTTIAEAPERAGVFRLNVTPTKDGAARMVIDVATDAGIEHFTVADVPVYASVAAAVAAQKPGEPDLISFAKERSWGEDFATAPVTSRYQGRMLLVPSTAVVRDGTSTSVYVQHTPERFEFRQVGVGQTFGNLVQVTSGLRDGDRVVIRGTDKMPRQ